MGFFQKNTSPMLPNQPREERKPRERKPATKEQKLLFGLVLGCSVVSTLLYFGIVALSQHMESLRTAQIMGIGIMVLYAVIGAGFLIAYIIYNRAFTRDNITPDMLPDTMSEHEKVAFIQSGVERKRKSRWMIVVLFAAFVPLAIDFLILTAIPTLFGGMLG
ncbi:MAG: hypothetical protein J6R46_01870 [Clostridia bacterium]|jgi:hypothetical protein|nr:hypothetical protein [Clostridia bacterium]